MVTVLTSEDISDKFTVVGIRTSVNYTQHGSVLDEKIIPLSEEIPCTLRNPKVHYRVHISPPLVTNLC
jgi:hypothetical protein